MNKRKVISSVIGIVSLVIGIFLRLNATNICWPDDWTYSGSRESTSWAIKELGVQQIGMGLAIFGAAVLLLVIANYLWTPENKKHIDDNNI